MQGKCYSSEKVSWAEVAVKTGRKWRAEVAVEQAESWLCHGVLVEVVARGNQGQHLKQ